MKKDNHPPIEWDVEAVHEEMSSALKRIQNQREEEEEKSGRESGFDDEDWNNMLTFNHYDNRTNTNNR